jgi:hypothetical protein
LVAIYVRSAELLNQLLENSRGNSQYIHTNSSRVSLCCLTLHTLRSAVAVCVAGCVAGADQRSGEPSR